MRVTKGMFSRTAVSSSWLFMRKPPSPVTASTGLSMFSIFVAKAPGTAKPMQASRISRPQWDLEVLKQIGVSDVKVDAAAGKRILDSRDLRDAPMFLLAGTKTKQ